VTGSTTIPQTSNKIDPAELVHRYGSNCLLAKIRAQILSGSSTF